jgi:hypothetical protein
MAPKPKKQGDSPTTTVSPSTTVPFVGPSSSTTMPPVMTTVPPVTPTTTPATTSTFPVIEPGSPTASAGGSATLPPGMTPEMQAFAQANPWLFATETGKNLIGGMGKVYVDKTTGRVLRYEGPTNKDVSVGELKQAQYVQGDEYQISGLSPEAIQQYQARLKKGGYFKPSETFTPGKVNESTINAMNRLLGDANLNFVTAESALETSQSNPYNGNGGGVPKYKITAAPDLETIFQSVAQKELGRSIDPEQMKSMVDTYQKREATGGKVAGSTVQMPSATGFATEQIPTVNQDEADAYKFVQYAQVFDKLLRA